MALGSNQGDSQALLARALELLDRSPGIAVDRVSPAYLTEPQGFIDQPWFLNQVARLIVVGYAPESLLDRLQAIELELGRVRGEERFGPRTLDLDLLTFGSETRVGERLTLPHPRMRARAFVLVPLLDVAGDVALPGLGPLRELLAGISYEVHGRIIRQAG